MNFVTNLFKGLSTKDKEQLEKKKDISTTTNTNTDGVVEDGKNANDTKLSADDQNKLDVFSNMGFIALIFSSLIPIVHMGGLMVFAMLSTSFGTLTILASIMEIQKQNILN